MVISCIPVSAIITVHLGDAGEGFYPRGCKSCLQQSLSSYKYFKSNHIIFGDVRQDFFPQTTAYTK